MDIVQFQEGTGYYVKVRRAVPKHAIKDALVIVYGGDDAVNRKALSSKVVDILLDPHLGVRRDKIHQRDSGLNQVLCALAKEKDVAIGFSFDAILHARKRSVVYGRIAQNIMLCRKYKLRMVVGSFARNSFGERNTKDIQALFKVLGMTGKEVAMDFVESRLDYKKRYIRKGVMKVRT